MDVEVKTKEEMISLKKQFITEYKSAFAKVGNNLAVGVGLDSKSGEPTLEARLTNNKLKTSLPETYHGTKVNIEIIGIIKPL